MAAHDTRRTRPKIPGWPVAIALAVLFLFLYVVRVVLLPFVAAVAVSFILSPLVDALHRGHRGPRWPDAVAIWFAVLVLTLGLLWWLGPTLAADVLSFSHNAPNVLHRIIQLFVGNNGRLSFAGESVDLRGSTDILVHRAQAWFAAQGGPTIAYFTVSAAIGTLLTFVLMAYFLIGGERLVERILWLAPPEHRAEIHEIVAKVAPVLRRYFVGVASVVFYATLLSWLAFGLVFNVPHAPLLAVSIGVLELLPVLGPAISLSLVGLVATQLGSVEAAIGLIGFAVALRLSIDQLVTPLIFGHAAYLPPVAVIFAFLSGGVFLGVIGLIIAVPVAATIKIALTHYYSERITPSAHQ